MFALDSETQLPVVVSDAGTRVPFIKDLETCRWPCHVHPSADCSMTYVNGMQYHIIPIKTGSCSKYAIDEYNRPPPRLRMVSNSSYGSNEFWEPLTSRSLDPPMICSFDKCSQRFDRNFISKMFKTIFNDLCIRNEHFFKYNTPLDMVHRHVLTDGYGNLSLCNRHLLVKHTRHASAVSPLTIPTAFENTAQLTAIRRCYKYTLRTWERGILKALFPKTDNTVPLEVRSWVNQTLNVDKPINTIIKRSQFENKRSVRNDTIAYGGES